MIPLADRLAAVEQERQRAVERGRVLASTATTPQDRVAFEKVLDWIFELDFYAALLKQGGPWRVPHEKRNRTKNTSRENFLAHSRAR
jgi:hypothetical protein